MVITSPHGKILRRKKGESLRSLARRQHKEFMKNKKKKEKKKKKKK